MNKYLRAYPRDMAIQVYVVARELGYYVEKIFLAGGLVLTVHCESEETLNTIESLARERKNKG